LKIFTQIMETSDVDDEKEAEREYLSEEEEESFDSDTDSLGITQITLAKTAEARLFVNKIVLENFKSYRGTREVGPFQKEFNAVVGANGSGKSNILDAFLFVFGSKPRNLRVKSFKELINNMEPRPKKASVKMYCYEVDRATNERIQGSDFTVSRVISRSGGTRFRINDDVKNINEIVQFWKSKKIDLASNRIFILQNQVENISTMSPKRSEANKDGLIEFLEEIIGSDRYIQRIEETTEKITAIETDQEVQLDKVKIMEGLMKTRAAKKDAVVKFILQLHETKCLRIKQLIRELFRAKESLRQSRSKVEAAQAELDELIVSQVSVVKEARKCQVIRKKAKKRAGQAQYSLDECTKLFRKSENKIASLNTKLQSKEKEKEKLEGKDKSMMGKAKKTKDLKAEHEAKIPGLEEGMEKDQERLSELQEQIEEQKALIMEKTKELRKELEEKEEELSGAQSFLLKAKEEYQEVLDYQKQRNRKVERIKKKLEDEEHRLVDGKTQSDRFKALGKKAVQRHQDVQEQLKQIVEQMTENEAHYGAANEEYEKCKRKWAELDQKFRSQPQMSSSGVVAKLLEAQENGRLQGIEGRLGDLGTIPAKYDIAVSSVAGGQMDWIVVNTGSQAESCIKYMKSKQLGRAKFIVLEKIQSSARYINPQNARPRIPQGCPRLLDEIQCAEKIKVAFAHVLRNTIIARDIEHAKVVAYDRSGRRAIHKAVTMDRGAIISLSGAMSGGGGRARRGAMKTREGRAFEQVDFDGPKITQKQVDEVLQKRNDAWKKVGQYNRMKRTNAAKMDSLSKEDNKLEREISKIDTRYSMLKQRREDLMNTITEMREKLEKAEQEVEEEIEKIQVDVDAKKTVLGTAEEEYNQQKAVVEETREKINQAGGRKYKDLQRKERKLDEKVSEAQETIDSFKQKINQAARKLKSFHGDSKKYAKIIEKLQKVIEQIENKIEAEKGTHEDLKKDEEKLLEGDKEAKKGAQRSVGETGGAGQNSSCVQDNTKSSKTDNCPCPDLNEQLT